MIPATADKYTRDYFLGAVDVETGKKFGAAGSEAFKKGKIDGRYMRFLRTLPLKGKNVLDMGCGRGDILRGVAKGCAYAVGVDFSLHACGLALGATKQWGHVKVRHMKFTHGMFDTVMGIADRQYEVMFLLDVIEHIPAEDMSKVYYMVYRALKPGGVLIIDTPMYKSKDDKDSSDAIPSTQGMHCNKQTKDSLYLDLLRRGFKKYSHNVWYKGKWSFKMWLYAKSIWPQTLLWKIGQVI